METARDKTSRSGFVVIPRTAKMLEFCVVRDAPEQDDFFPKLKKFPGGGVKGRETSIEAAGKEVAEETRLRIENEFLTHVLEIHKRNFDRKNNIVEAPHQDFFYLSDPPTEDRRPRPEKKGIVYAEWEAVEQIRDEISKRDMYPNHSTAFSWVFLRPGYLALIESGVKEEKEEAEKMLAPLLERKGLRRWLVTEGTLVLCFDMRCEDSRCKTFAHEIKKEETWRSARGTKPVRETVKEEGAQPREEDHKLPDRIKPRLHGLVKLALLSPAPNPRGEDYAAFVETDKWGMALPANRVNDVSPEETISILGDLERGENDFTLLGVEGSESGRFLAVWKAKLPKNSRLVPMCLNVPPSRNFRFQKEDLLDLLRAVELFNRKVPGQERIALHFEWERKAWARRVEKTE